MHLSRTLELAGLLNEAKWSADVKEKHHAPEGLFLNGSAEKIANWAWTSHDHDLRSAMASLSFAINRAGKTMSTEMTSKIESAKILLRAKAK